MEETTPFPFLHNQDLDFSHFFNIFQDMDNNSTGSGDGNGPFKRRKTEDDEFGAKKNENNELRDVLTSLFFVDDEERAESERWAADSLLERSLFDQNCKKTEQVMTDYYSQMDQHYGQTNEVDSARKSAKRARSVAVIAAASAGEEKSPVRRESGNSGPARRLWVKDRSKDWWDRVSRPDFPEEEFRKAFRMSRATFDMICDELDSAVTKKNTTLRDAIPVRQRVAVCIWRLATGQPLRLVSKLFGLGISTCHKLILEVCTAIRTVLLPKFVKWPTDDGLVNSIKEGFESISGIPDIGGSMYTTHVPIIAPKVSVAAYYNKRHTERNQKTSYSITVQGVVDCRGIFTDISIGWPGSFSDDHVLENSTLHKKAATGRFDNLCIAANSGYPLTDWVLVPYTHQNLTWTHDTFNKKIGEVLRVGKEAFCRLKGRWACLQKRIDMKLTDLPVVLGACCVLHNICELRGEEMSDDLRFEVFDDEVVPVNNIRSVAAAQARDQIAHNLFHHCCRNTFL